MKVLVLHGLFNYIIFDVGLLYAIKSVIDIILIESREWIDKEAGLTLNKDVLINNLNYYSSGIFPFQEITGTKETHYRKYEYLVIFVKHPQNFIFNKSFFQKLLLKKVQKVMGSPLVIRNTGN